MKKDINTLYCTTCGSDKAQIRACIEVNTNKFCSDTDEGSAYCPDCDDTCDLINIMGLWDTFCKNPSRQQRQYRGRFSLV